MGTITLQNASFESPDLPDGTNNFFNAILTGWKTTAADTRVEIWGTFFSGVMSADGFQHAELNANFASTLYQDVATTPGTSYTYTFFHRGRDGVDTMTLRAGPPAGPAVDVHTLSTDRFFWKGATGTWTVPVGQVVTRLAFVSVSASGGLGTRGNLLDGISFAPTCATDTDHDGLIDIQDLDSDGDGLWDGDEGGVPNVGATGTVPGSYGTNGFADSVETSPDSGVPDYSDADADGVSDRLDVCPGFDDADDGDADGVASGCDLCPADAENDAELDGWCESDDNCPDIVNADQLDLDGDGLGDACDDDVDGDGVIDADDAWPTDPRYSADTDGDGVADNIDACEGWDDAVDTDLDGVPDGDGLGICDLCPLDAENDADLDGLCESDDNCVDLANADQSDGDGDAVGDACDVCDGDDALGDTDLDRYCDDTDVFPEDPTEHADDDGDGVGNVADACPGFDDLVDDDVDHLPDGCDACPGDAWNDVDLDGVCGDVDLCADADDALDTDGDTTPDCLDTCPTDPDTDADDVCADVDNCAYDANADQTDTDGDAFGDACDLCDGDDTTGDADGDLVCDDLDAFPDDASETVDGDGDGVGDNADACPTVASTAADGCPVTAPPEDDCTHHGNGNAYGHSRSNGRGNAYGHCRG